MASIGFRTLTSISVALTALFIGESALAQSDLRRVDGGKIALAQPVGTLRFWSSEAYLTPRRPSDN